MDMTDIKKCVLKAKGGVPGRSELPVRMTRRSAAEFLRQYYFQISPRSLERAAIPWTILNGQAHALTTDLIEYGEATLAAAPVIKSGRSDDKH
jgi:hypothetical protein